MRTLLAGGYSAQQSEERLRLTVGGEGQKETAAEVVWRFQPGGPLERSMRVDLGPLLVFAAGTRLVAVNARNPGTYFEASLRDGLTAAAIREVMPPLPFPQAAWALGDPGPGGIGGVLAATQWTDLTAAEGEACRVTLVGATPWGNARATVDPGSPPYASLCTWESPVGTGAGLRISVSVERLTRSEPGGWVLATEGRMRVASMADLKAAEPPVAPGERMPVMGIMTAELGSWSLAEALETVSDGPLNDVDDTRPVESFAVLVLARPDAPGAAGAAEAARAAAAAFGRDLDRRRHTGRTTLPRCFVRVVNVMDLNQISDPSGARAKAAAQPLPTSEPSSVPLFAAGGKPLMDAFAPGAAVIVLVVGPSERLAASMAIDAGAEFDGPVFTNRLRDAVVGPHDAGETAGAR